ncbi:hypothetical protein B0T09DRAFT_359220 [Sordaria sp. MPI-SDFR-AT-0083]|nr:hypothetical protein B0T09DRAFT_359220 [Sordaria sp. MPI-SDFR-AT-0083]
MSITSNALSGSLDEATASPGSSRSQSIASQPVAPFQTSTQGNAPHSSHSQTTTTNRASLVSGNVKMTDIITATGNLSLHNRPIRPQSHNRRALQAHRRGPAESLRVEAQRHRGFSTIMANIQARQTAQASLSHSPRTRQVRPRTPLSRLSRLSRQVRQESTRFLSQCAHIHQRQSIRAQRRSQVPTSLNTTLVQSTSAVAMAELRHRSMLRSNAQFLQEVRIISAIAARVGHYERLVAGWYGLVAG